MTKRVFKPRTNTHKRFLINTGQLPAERLQIAEASSDYKKVRILRIRQQWEDVLRQLDTDSATHRGVGN